MATLRQLRVFTAVAEFKKMSTAAKHLYISQPTISQIISELEKEYNTQLFDRHQKELQITPSGTLLLESARQILAIHDNLEQKMKHLGSLRPLRIGATMTVGNNMMSDVQSSLQELYPDIEVYVYVNNTRHIEQRLSENELDIALVEGIIHREEIISKPATIDDLCLVCSKDHPFAGREHVSMEELRNEKFILREKGSGTRAIFEELMMEHRIPIHAAWECGSTKAIADAVQCNLGLGFLSEVCVAKQVAAGDICICQVPELTRQRYFYLCYNRNHPVTSQMQNLMELVEDLPTAIGNVEIKNLL
jgi:DNA-binding transcriptional LysR family regulator